MTLVRQGLSAQSHGLAKPTRRVPLTPYFAHVQDKQIGLTQAWAMQPLLVGFVAKGNRNLHDVMLNGSAEPESKGKNSFPKNKGKPGHPGPD